MTDHIPNDELDTIMSEIILEITKADYENPYNHPIDEIDAIVFEIAKDIEINCQLFNIAPHPFQPCRKYKWYFSNPTQYYQVEIKTVNSGSDLAENTTKDSKWQIQKSQS